ncbi:MAG TPA: photosynthetic reaction center cytochrome c subunit family protein [Labilithrix sp.]
MNPIKASAMSDDLKALGLDPKKLPPLNKIEPEKLRKVMKIISNALGTQCTGCHDANDFRAWTPNKKVASHMWNDWVRGLAMNDGGVLFCDSCHQGHMKFLDRGDKKALGKWMEANFVTPLKRLDKKDHACATCHGEDFDPKFLDKWEAEAKK